MLDRSKKGSPLYYQLKDVILKQIEEGHWIVGDKIPTEGELCELFKVSRTTVRLTLAELVNEGVLYRIQGSGTFVAEHALQGERPKLLGLVEDFEKKGNKVKSTVIQAGVVPVTNETTRNLELIWEKNVYQLKRVRIVNQEIIGLQDAYIRSSLLNVDLNSYDFSNQSLYRTLKNDAGIVLTEAIEKVKAVLADEETAVLLGIKSGSPLLYIERVTKTDKGPIEFTKMYFLPDKFQYVNVLKTTD
ncbi:GntR family transcriptional regulator [Paenibacillus gorillae]|uniref:GntR family transcriptional regulator n=1 Tax=Paenibacillus gorillae TaxID=1243662 RepID=UPI0004AD2FDD|nr:GntR family transcriptional regulator [Paenibacillus gorillae]